MPVLDVEAVRRFAAEGVLLDARSEERYRGEAEPLDRRAGHIPGAFNRPAGANLGPDGRFRGAGALRASFAAEGIKSGMSIGVYCGSGITAAHTVLALELAGFEAALYPGSWSEWVADPSRPVATGDEPAGALERLLPKPAGRSCP
jgi:thiosulfate/3-mercaptopyruvate sulfurtransferase